ncbi:phosphohydrolase [Siphonobacter sp. BAB-5405]|uniref:HD domain-containing protein n=1 Tax=Siphonobacter sp. BAB-5405 TaxID=1864825 RepID=UPI000C80A131|nr:HD domain-containing protein [Siphonobacter sp. BAB-5405]PMD89692.1 phosphohydrolase [Siphonobacter sp. BAB-5405]
MNLIQAEAFILDLLRQQLPETLYYHGLHHTEDVVRAAEWLARSEGVEDQESLMLLRTAALYHDCGFMYTYENHEEAGCEVVEQCLSTFGYSAGQIELICGMIRATKVPQNPQTHLEQILCDADLDYLGRPGFESISHTLYQELQARHLIGTEAEWLQKQITFLSSHQYWTATALAHRQPAKAVQLELLQNQATLLEP